MCKGSHTRFTHTFNKDSFYLLRMNEMTTKKKKKKHEMSTVGYLTQGIGGTDTHLHAPQPEA